MRLKVKAVHQPIGAVQAIRAHLNSSTLKQLAPIWSPQSLRMSAIVLDLVSKGRLSAFGRVSFVTFLWRNKEKFIFNTHLGFCYSLLPQPDRWVRAKVKSVHQPIGALQAIRTYLTDAVR